MMTDTLDTGAGGNTLSRLKPLRSRGWCFTLNNYEEKDVTHICVEFGTPGTDYIVGREVGEEKTPHLQGYVRFRNARAFASVKRMFGDKNPHIEKAKGSIKQNVKYCSKDGDFETNIDLIPPRERIAKLCMVEYRDVKWRPFQQAVLDILDKEPHQRYIYWYWEPTGNVGKSYLMKYLALTRKVVICNGKKDNVFNQVNIMLDKGIQPKVILMDIPRSGKQYINYTEIEELKNGMFYSGKYEGGQCIYPKPTVIIMANFLPMLQNMSLDMWQVEMIK